MLTYVCHSLLENQDSEKVGRALWSRGRELGSQGRVTRVEGSNPGHGKEVFLEFQERDRSRLRNYMITDLKRGEKNNL